MSDNWTKPYLCLHHKTQHCAWNWGGEDKLWVCWEKKKTTEKQQKAQNISRCQAVQLIYLSHGNYNLLKINTADGCRVGKGNGVVSQHLRVCHSGVGGNKKKKSEGTFQDSASATTQQSFHVPVHSWICACGIYRAAAPACWPWVLMESSCQLKTRSVVEWRVLFSGGGESEQWRGGRTCVGDVKHQKQEVATFFFLGWKDTFRCVYVCGSQSRSSLFYSSEFIPLDLWRNRGGDSGQTAFFAWNQYPAILWPHQRPPTSQRDERGVSGRSCGQLRHRCHVRRGVTSGVWVSGVLGFWTLEWVNKPSGNADAGVMRTAVEKKKKGGEKGSAGCKVRVSQRNTSNSLLRCYYLFTSRVSTFDTEPQYPKTNANYK